jgi:serine/threonine-protein kinase
MGQKVDSRSDLFSAGVVLYKLLTGVLPFEGDSIITVAVKIAQSEPPMIEKLRPDVPLSLRRVVDRALKKQPEKRYQSGEDMAQALIGVAREMKEQEDAKAAGRRVSLGVRWAAIMAVLVGLTMLATAGILYNRQYQAMMDQVLGYGESLAKFMSTQNAVPLLGEDWAAIEVFIQETMTRQNFPYLVVTDDEGFVRGSNDPAQIGQKYVEQQGRPVATPDKSLTVQSLALPDGRDVLNFRSPILFQGTKIGDVHLGILEEPLSRVARLILTLLGILTLVTIGTVVLGVYLLARRLARPIRTLKSGLDEIAAGRYDFRIADKRTDEFGELFRAYDRTAAALEARHDRPGAPAIPPGEGTIIVAGPAAAGAKVES